MDIRLKNINRPFWYRFALFIFFQVFFLAWLLIKPLPHTQYTVSVDIVSSTGYMIGTCFCFHNLKKWKNNTLFSAKTTSTTRRMQLWLPMLFGLSGFCNGVGQIIYTCYDIYHLAVFSSLASVLLMLAYILSVLGIFFLPTKPLTGFARSRVFLDSLMIMIALITFSWYFLLGPIVLQGNGTMFDRAMGMLYPLAHLALLFGLIFLSSRSSDVTIRPTLSLLSVSILIVVCADSIYDYQMLHGGYATGSLLDLLWPLGSMLFGLATYALQTSRGWENIAAQAAAQHSQEASNDYTRVSWHSFLPYVLIPPVLFLWISTWWIDSHGPLVLGICILGSLLIGLVLVRQIVALRETDLYARQMKRLNSDLFYANTRLEELATTDPLTGLPNHRTLVSLLDEELERTQRYTRSCALLFLDIDHFKALNDGYGHSTGDAILHDFASLVSSQLRSIDTIGRWGGEEFVAILPEVHPDDAYDIAARVCARVAEHTFSVSGGIRLTCSIGVACYPTHAQTREELIQCADQAMYGAKHLGRNQVRFAHDNAVLALLSETTEGGREKDALAGTVEVLAALVEAHDTSTGKHSQEVSDLIRQLAFLLGLTPTEARMISIAGQLHDIGKVAIPDTILRKPGPLTDEEWALMRTHPELGANMVSFVPTLRPLAPIIRAHHERWDGRGYPDALSREIIPFGARIIAVVDAYMAMTEDRPYQKARPAEEAVEELKRCAGTQFDPLIVAALERLLRVSQEQRQVAVAGLT
jgi:two-component system, cell cycle response regulator